jgi:hypothetical protein
LEAEAGWDGEKANPITKETCEAAILFSLMIEAQALEGPLFIAPCVNGAIAFTWRGKAGLLDIQVLDQSQGGCKVRWSHPSARATKKCSASESLIELRTFFGRT